MKRRRRSEISYSTSQQNSGVLGCFHDKPISKRFRQTRGVGFLGMASTFTLPRGSALLVLSLQLKTSRNAERLKLVGVQSSSRRGSQQRRPRVKAAGVHQHGPIGTKMACAGRSLVTPQPAWLNAVLGPYVR